MGESKWGDVLGIFQDAICSLVGRVVGFFLVCWLSMAFTAFFLDSNWRTELLSPFGLYFMFFAGVAQVWGFMAFIVLLWLFRVLVTSEESALRTLTVTALVQSLEVWRFEMTGAGWRWSLAKAVFIACWAVFAGGFAFLVWREKAARGSAP